MVPIPGYGVNIRVMKAGVFLKVGLRPKGNKLALMVSKLYIQLSRSGHLSKADSKFIPC